MFVKFQQCSQGRTVSIVQGCQMSPVHKHKNLNPDPFLGVSNRISPAQFPDCCLEAGDELCLYIDVFFPTWTPRAITTKLRERKRRYLMARTHGSLFQSSFLIPFPRMIYNRHFKVLRRQPSPLLESMSIHGKISTAYNLHDMSILPKVGYSVTFGTPSNRSKRSFGCLIQSPFYHLSTYVR